MTWAIPADSAAGHLCSLCDMGLLVPLHTCMHARPALSSMGRLAQHSSFRRNNPARPPEAPAGSRKSGDSQILSKPLQQLSSSRLRLEPEPDLGFDSILVVTKGLPSLQRTLATQTVTPCLGTVFRKMMLETMKLKARPLVQGNFSRACIYSCCLVGL